MIGSSLDAVHNALGRPRYSVDYALIAGTGCQEWTRTTRPEKPQLMKLLAANLRSTEHPSLQDSKEGLGSQVETAARTLAQAVDALTNAELVVRILKKRRRALAQAAQVMLSRLKRDFLNAGLTQAQIHEIVPSEPRSRSAPVQPGAEIPAEITTDPQADSLEVLEPAPRSAA